MKLILTILTSICAINFAFTQIPTDNLILHLPFIGSAEDMSGNDLDGTVEGAILTDDRLGIDENAYSFDGSDDFISILADPLMDVEFPFSISLWYYRSTPAVEVETLFKSDANSDIYSGFWISMAATGEIAAGYGDGIGYGIGHRVSKRTTDPLSVGEWHNVLAVFNNLEDIDIYIDCEAVLGEYSGTGSSMGYLGGNSTIGTYSWRYFDGIIDDIRVYNDAITETEARYFCQDSTIQTNSIIDSPQTPTILNIYPNPSSNVLNLDFGIAYRLMKDYNYSIVDLDGKTVYSSIIDNQNIQINLNNLGIARGVYLIQILNKSVELIESTQFIYD